MVRPTAPEKQLDGKQTCFSSTGLVVLHINVLLCGDYKDDKDSNTNWFGWLLPGNWILVLLCKQAKCKHPAHSCVVDCKERGGALPTVTDLTAQGMTIMLLFVVQVIIAA